MIKIKKSNEDSLSLEFTNGDIELLNKAKDKFEFDSYEATLRFAMSVLVIAEDKSIRIKQNNSFVSVSPVKTSSENKGE